MAHGAIMSARQVLILGVLRLEGRAAPTESYGLTTGRLSQRLQSSVPFCVGSACPLMSRLETVERYAQPVQRTEWAAGLHNFRRVATVLGRVRRCVEMFPGLPLRASAPESAGGVIIPLCPPPRHPVGQNLGPEESELSSGAAHVVAEPVEGADQVADGPEFPRREASLSIYNRKCIRVLLLVAPALKGCGVRWFVVTRRAPVQSSAEELRPVRLDMVPHPSPFTHLGMPNY
jgi:hypothetical protein